MLPFDEFVGSILLPKVYVKPWVAWTNLHDSSSGNESYSEMLFHLKDVTMVKGDIEWSDYNFAPIVNRVEYLESYLEALKKSIKVTQKDKFILENSKHPTFSFEKKEWLMDNMTELLETKFHLIQLLEGVLQTHEFIRKKKREKRERYLKNRRNRDRSVDEVDDGR